MTGALAGPAVDLTRAGRERVHQVLPRIRSVLDALIRIPSVSAESERAPAMRASADAVAAAFAGIGLDARVVVVDGGQPAVIASTVPQVAARPRVLLYAHHDVQPAGPGWSVAPFEPLERDGRLYGRGSADDKGGIAVHLAALLAAGDDLAYDVTVLVEGEEEIGSPTLAATLARYGEDLRADLVLVPDAVNEAGGVPTVTTRLRGLAQVLVRVSTADGPVHSGLYGGAAPDALTTLARLLATLHDEDGRVAVTGLLTEPDAPSPLAGDFRAGARLLPDTVSIGHGSLADRLVGGPAISVIAIEAPTLAESANVLVPTAAARISLRTVAGQPARHAQAALAEHLTAHAPWGATVEITLETTGDGVDLSAEKPLQRLSFDALSSAFGQPVRLVGAGGSIPFVGALAAALPDASIVVTAVQDPSTRAHAEDESLDLAALENAALAEFLILTDGMRSARP